MKRLKIKFVKFENALALQTLEQEGVFEQKDDPTIGDKNPLLYKIILNVKEEHAYDISIKFFDDNQERDKYLPLLIKSITDKMFDCVDELKVGELCEVRDRYSKGWHKAILLAILPKELLNDRYIVQTPNAKLWTSWQCARPLQSKSEPIIEESRDVITVTWVV